MHRNGASANGVRVLGLRQLVFLVLVLGLNLLLLLDGGPDFPGCIWRDYHFIGVSVIIRQPQPDMRHVG